MLLPFTFAAIPFLISTFPTVASVANVVSEKYNASEPPTLVDILEELQEPEEDFRDSEPSTTDDLKEKFPEPSVTAEAEPPKPKRFICKSCNTNEQRTLAFLQDQGIHDKNALATIMGNIRQESMFIPNICEGGARVHYHGCHRGGYGLIQWTTVGRYRGLGNHANAKGMNPSQLETQLSYMLTEREWKLVENRMKTPGKSIDRYMNYAYTWLGWGVHGARTNYAHSYLRKFTLDS